MTKADDECLFAYRFATRSLHTAVAIVLAMGLSAIVTPFALLGAYKSYSEANDVMDWVFAIAMICLAVLCPSVTAKSMWDWVFPKSYTLALFRDSLHWYTPKADMTVCLSDVAHILGDNDSETPLILITLHSGAKLRVSLSCLGSLEEFYNQLCSVYPKERVQYRGPVKLFFRRRAKGL